MKFTVKDKISDFIIIPLNAHEAVLHAAEELQLFIEKASKTFLNIVTDDCLPIKEQKIISIGNTVLFEKSEIIIDKQKLNTDGYIIKITDNVIYINGYCNNGIIFGVYGFLEKFFGIRFIANDCTYIPDVKEINFVNQEICVAPEFPLRCYLSGKLHRQTADEDYLMRLGYNHTFIIKEKKYGENAPLYGRRGGTHNMHLYVPREIYGDTHPEFYYFLKEHNVWTIDLFNGVTDDGKLDESKDVSVVKIVIQELKKDIIAHPEIDYFDFEHEDGGCFQYPEGSKEQNQINKYGRSGILIRFCNILAKELQKWADKELNGRKIYIYTNAYAFTHKAPVKYIDGKAAPIDDTVIAEDNLVIRLALGSNCAFDYFSEKQNVELKNDFAEWKTIAKRFMFWGYDTDFVSYLWYYPTLRHASNNIKGLKKLGIIYAMFQSSYNSSEDWQSDLKAYIYSKLMWNINANVEELFNEYISHYYGLAATYVKEMITLMENYFDFLKDIFPGLNITTTGNYRYTDLYNKKMLDKAIELIDDAEEIIKNNYQKSEAEIYLKRLASVKSTPLHMRLVKMVENTYRAVNKAGIIMFNELQEIPENKDQTFFNVYEHTKKRVVIPQEVIDKVNNFELKDLNCKLF